MTERVDVLDHGYVRWVDHMGTDLSVVNAARVSFEKESQKFSDSDLSLMRYLRRKNEWSPFRHAVITFEVYAPLMVARQWWKYVVGSDHTMDAWNESSRRYVTEEPVYYSPEWRATPENKKQGSGELLPNPAASDLLRIRQEQSIRDYEAAIESGIAPEQARIFLLAYGLYVRWRWTASLQSVLHFISQRLGEGAQSEISAYAEGVQRLTAERFPISSGA